MPADVEPTHQDLSQRCVIVMYSVAHQVYSLLFMSWSRFSGSNLLQITFFYFWLEADKVVPIYPHFTVFYFRQTCRGLLPVLSDEITPITHRMNQSTKRVCNMCKSRPFISPARSLEIWWDQHLSVGFTPLCHSTRYLVSRQRLGVHLMLVDCWSSIGFTSCIAGNKTIYLTMVGSLSPQSAGLMSGQRCVFAVFLHGAHKFWPKSQENLKHIYSLLLTLWNESNDINLSIISVDSRPYCVSFKPTIHTEWFCK